MFPGVHLRFVLCSGPTLTLISPPQQQCALYVFAVSTISTVMQGVWSAFEIVSLVLACSLGRRALYLFCVCERRVVLPVTLITNKPKLDSALIGGLPFGFSVGPPESLTCNTSCSANADK
jgi:hypothetical protein